jgi:hypothetical protein
VADPIIIQDSTSAPAGPQTAVHPADFGLVQLFDLGWVFDPGYQRLLDNLAASPGAFSAVRVMKVFTNGIATTQSNPPRGALPNEPGFGTATGGNVWPANGTIDLSGTLDGLYELTRRKLTPFIVLGFFPDGIYGNLLPPPVNDPTCRILAPTFTGIGDPNWLAIRNNWKTLVQDFFDALLHDTRFGAKAIGTWWFEVWNEPDDPGFWYPDGGFGPLAYYQSLYSATSEVATDYKIRLGGPTVTNYFSPIAQTLQPFISYVASNKLQCDFISFHGKGAWDFCLNAPTYLSSAVGTAGQVAQWAKSAGLTSIRIINDEADMRANFAAPFLPRMTAQYPAWLAALMISYDSLNSQYAPIEFMTGSDNAELPLVGWLEQSTTNAQPAATSFQPAAFGQQRSIMTGASAETNGTTWSQTACPIDLLKVPVYNFYELLRLLGNQHGTAGAIPVTDVFHMITVATTHIGSIFCRYIEPVPGHQGPPVRPAELKYSIQGITWPKINWYQFQIDGTASNGYAQSGGPTALPDFCLPATLGQFPATSVALPLSFAKVRDIRKHQELAVVGHATNVSPGAFNPEFTLAPNTTTVFWITEFTKTVPPAPTWAAKPHALDVTDYGNNVVLFWQPDTDPTFYSYQVFRNGNLVSPMPLRSALWVDTGLGRGMHTYYLVALSASGVASLQSTPLTIKVP